MSRCFGFPPPGYSRNCEKNENDALILSIKLQKENGKAISDRERKEKKREKKERMKLKEKEKSHHHAVDGPLKLKQVANLYEADRYRVLSDAKCSLKQVKSEQLEKSSVTEEHGQPIDLDKASCSSDSTGNSSKRKRTSVPEPSSIKSHGNGNILRIRLSSMKTEDQPSTSGHNVQGASIPLPKREEHKTMSFHNSQPCSGVLRGPPSVKPKDIKLSLGNNQKLNIASTSTSGAALHSVSRHDQKLLGLSEKIAPVKSEKVAPVPAAAPRLAVKAALVKSEKIASVPVPLPLPVPVPVPAPATPAPKEEKLSSHEKKILKREIKYAKLFGNWVPPTIQHELVMDDDDDNDEDWLFGNKGGDEKSAKRLKPSDSNINGETPAVPCASAVLQPHASFLSDVGIYALPFTLPF